MIRLEKSKPKPGATQPPKGTKEAASASGKQEPKPQPVITDYASI